MRVTLLVKENTSLKDGGLQHTVATPPDKKKKDRSQWRKEQGIVESGPEAGKGSIYCFYYFFSFVQEHLYQSSISLLM